MQRLQLGYLKQKAITRRWQDNTVQTDGNCREHLTTGKYNLSTSQPGKHSLTHACSERIREEEKEIERERDRERQRQTEREEGKRETTLRFLQGLMSLSGRHRYSSDLYAAPNSSNVVA